MQDKSPTSLIHARGLTKRFGEFVAVDAIDFDVARGESFGFLGPERRGQDLDDADDRLRLADHRRRPAGDGPRPRDARPADPRQPRRRPPAGHPRHRADRPREPRDLRSLLRSQPGRGRPARRRAARVRPADRARRRPGRAAVGRDEAPPDDRPLAHQRARRSCSSTSRRPASTRRPATCCGTGSTGSSSAA